MDDKIGDGGQAFPTELTFDMRGKCANSHGKLSGGMTLRDYLAAQALCGIIAAENSPAGDWPQCAADAYRAADAMLEVRDK